MEKIALTPRSKELIKNYLIGGAALGGSGALLTSLVNYINTLKQQVPSDKEKEDDDTLYLNVNKSANESSGATDLAAGGVALTGGLLSTLGTYALVRKLYQNIKRKQLQEELDQAQQSFLTDAQQEADVKNAAVGEPMNLAELAWSAPTAFTLLSAIAAGALTNKALDKTFPRVKKPKDSAPKRIVIRKNPKEEEEDEEEKMASIEQTDDAVEFLMHLCMGSKSASQSDLVDIVYATAQGRGPELISNILEYGFDSAMDTIKGASEIDITPAQKQCAISYCVKNAALNPIVTLLAAAEYNDMAPKFTKIASLQNEDCLETLVKIAGTIGALNRAEMSEKLDISFEISKQANDMSIEEILALINRMKSQGAKPDGFDGGHTSEEDDIEQNEDLNTEDSLDSGEEKQVNDRKPFAGNNATPDVIDELSEDDDFIDQAMSTPVTPAKAVAAENK